MGMLPEYLRSLSNNLTMVAPANTTPLDYISIEESNSHENSNNSEDKCNFIETFKHDSEYSSLLEVPTSYSIISNSAVEILGEFNDFSNLIPLCCPKDEQRVQ